MRCVWFAAMLLLVATSFLAAGEREEGLTGQKLPARQVLVDGEWLAKQTGQPNVRILDVSTDPASYDKGHIAGAVKLNWKEDLFSADRKNIPTLEEFQRLCKRLAITPETLVVFYGDEEYVPLTYAYWIFSIYCHENAKVLDGGRKKWLLEKRPLVTETPKLPDVPDYQVPGSDLTSRAELAEITSVVKQLLPGILIDTRPPEAFAGKMTEPPGSEQQADGKPLYARAGNIKLSVNLPPSESLLAEDGTFKSETLLRKIFERKNVEELNICYPYGWTRVDATFNWFVLKMLLNYKEVRVYDGGWLEYSNTTLPLGPAPAAENKNEAPPAK